jgi:glycosyltransferase involved in cell wall biosynthesis
MRVALVGNWPRPYGGVAVHVAALCRALRARGADVVVLDIGHGDHTGAGVRPARGVLRCAAALSGVAAAGRLVHLHTNGANRKSWLLALAVGRARRPFAPRPVLTIHSGSAPAWLRGGAARRALAAAACAGYGAVVAVNEEIAAALARAGVPRERLSVLAPFAPAVLEPPAPPPGLAAFLAGRAPVLCAALAPDPLYGADLLGPAFAALRARHPRAALVVFGPGTETPGAPWPPDAVRGLGEVDHAAALAVMAAADVFVRPTRADGDAVSVREALAMGCQVVASAVGHRPSPCLRFPAGDGAALLAALEEAVARGRRAGGRTGERGADVFEALHALYRRLGAGRERSGAPPSASRVGAGRARPA